MLSTEGVYLIIVTLATSLSQSINKDILLFIIQLLMLFLSVNLISIS